MLLNLNDEYLIDMEKFPWVQVATDQSEELGLWFSDEKGLARFQCDGVRNRKEVMANIFECLTTKNKLHVIYSTAGNTYHSR